MLTNIKTCKVGWLVGWLVSVTCGTTSAHIHAYCYPLFDSRGLLRQVWLSLKVDFSYM